jgi:hypothetical protein
MLRLFPLPCDAKGAGFTIGHLPVGKGRGALCPSQAVVQGLAGDAQQLGGNPLIAVGNVQRLADQLCFRLPFNIALYYIARFFTL